MADYCFKCAKKYGMQPEIPPLFCEGCGKEVTEKNILKRIINYIITRKQYRKRFYRK